MLLEVNDLAVSYGTAQVLKGISLTVAEGEVVALIGANGAGKTTLLRTVSGLKSADSGEVRFLGRRIDNEPPHEVVRRGIAHIPEGRMVFCPLSVLDNLHMGAYLRRDKKGIAADLERIYDLFPVLKQRSKQA